MGRVLIDVQQQMANQLLALPLARPPGHAARRRADAHAQRLADRARRARTLIGDVLESAIAIVVSVATLLVISWQLTLATLIVAPALALVVALFGRRIRTRARRRQETVGEVTQRLVGILSGIKVIKAFRAERAGRSRLRARQPAPLRSQHEGRVEPRVVEERGRRAHQPGGPRGARRRHLPGAARPLRPDRRLAGSLRDGDAHHAAHRQGADQEPGRRSRTPRRRPSASSSCSTRRSRRPTRRTRCASPASARASRSPRSRSRTDASRCCATCR